MSAKDRDSGEEILKAAAQLFGERGYKGTTTRAIAERAGVNEVTIFRRFANKQGVLRALTEMWAGKMAGFAVGTIPEATDTRGTLEYLARMEVAQAMEFGGAALRLAIDARSVPEVEAMTGDGTSQNLHHLVDYLSSRQGAGDLRDDLDPHVMAEAFFALTSTLVMSRQVIGDGSIPYDLPSDEVVRQLIELYLAGVAPKEAAR